MINHMADQKALRITDLTLRDGHQSLFATRMKTDDRHGIPEKNMGYHEIRLLVNIIFRDLISLAQSDSFNSI
jgi:pyruvate carboxylase subunit B